MECRVLPWSVNVILLHPLKGDVALRTGAIFLKIEYKKHNDSDSHTGQWNRKEASAFAHNRTNPLTVNFLHSM